MDKKIYKYYSLHRPIDLGTYPKENMIDFLNYNTRTFVENIGQLAWAEIFYSQPLTEKQINDYEFYKEPENKNVVPEGKYPSGQTVIEKGNKKVTDELKEVPHGENEKVEENEVLPMSENETVSSKDELMQKLKNGIKKTLDSEQFADWCKKQGKLYYNNYSINNALLTYFQKPEATYVCGYETWKTYGRQVKKGAQSIKILAPIFAKEYGGKGSLFASIKKSCMEQFKKDPFLEYASFQLGQSKLSFSMYKNSLFDVKLNNVVKMAHITSEEMRKFIDQSVIGKIPTFYNAVPVFDISDTTNDSEFLWVNKDACKKDEMVLDDNGNPITNKRKQVKIYNSEERKARFNTNIDMVIKENDTEKMQVLYETLQKISNEKKIPFAEMDPLKDDTLAGGALGYFRHATPEYPNGNIVVSNELSLTNKVAVAFHETAHSDLHSNIDKLKEEMGNDVEITRQMKEVQAEAVAYMTASTFGIETEHKSFGYIANWSDGRELKALESSLDVIYKESRRLLKEIETELDKRGLSMAFEVKDKTPLTEIEKKATITEYKDFVLNTLRLNESIQKSLFMHVKLLESEEQKVIVKEQIALTHKIEEKLASLNTKISQFEQESQRQEQVNLIYQLRAEREQIKSLITKVNNLTIEKEEVMKGESAESQEDIKLIYASNPLLAIEKLKNDFSQMQNLLSSDLKYLANSKFISDTYYQYLGNNNEKFVDLCMKQLENFQKTLSKNKTVVEVSLCEQWGEKAIFVNGTLAHPKEANKIIAQEEKQIRVFKEQAKEKDEYYPYTKCYLSVYNLMDKNELTILDTRIDIGDGEQKDLTDHLTQICEADKGKQRLLNNYLKSTRERGNIQLEVPKKEEIIAEAQKKEQIVGEGIVHSMSDWKNDLNQSQQINTEERTDRNEHDKEDKQEKEC